MLKISLGSQVWLKEHKGHFTMTAKKLGAAVGVTEKTALKYMRGENRQVNLDVLGRMASYFGCAPGDLIIDTEATE